MKRRRQGKSRSEERGPKNDGDDGEESNKENEPKNEGDQKKIKTRIKNRKTLRTKKTKTRTTFSQQVQSLLEAMNNQEEKVQDKINAKIKRVPIKGEKDW